MEDEQSGEYCELIDRNLPPDHDFFLYESHVKIVKSFLGLAVSEARNVEKLRTMLDILDTLNQNLYDNETVLADNVRKQLRRETKEWIDIDQKMDNGDKYTAYLVLAASNLRIALSYLWRLSKLPDFSDHITEYPLEFMQKLINMINNEAMGNVLL
ncbi:MULTISPECIES: DUF1940 domain-containing protein [Ferroplasma]|jgi:hypothetical protein|uniref:Uncharacterized protein n=2 Tax=Ferroplasma TaxID=74968 RepID=S0ANY1_FERAC|nr:MULTISPECIES: DUF1940 domain-containing protein [Ferroplasma]MCL4349697.1 DUF1940 domain-containing protein [Candidatus Thermoplasmatota archaeon]AGO60616.1 hypothetical protein FACI_IFERC00001G0636 [Ferroplasma acidarmanus Fer1]ARD85378.1 hypothetical protein FAD_1528 [Ferroplasma acidiphilum]NOL59726.1 DUF1940 domain-containing protein [Ferroplasma acidiphilum]WMT52485.1 MAG: DUF1940 domain-containing protein [Ferroplasma acidiphilum]